MLTGVNRKRWNRALKRKIEQGIISVEEAQQKFIRAQSSCSKKKAEDGIVAEEEAKSKRSSRTVEGLVNDGETKIAVQAFSPLEETVVAEEAVKKEKRQKKTAKLNKLKTATTQADQNYVYRRSSSKKKAREVA